MSRKTQTTVTFEVRVVIPTGSNTSAVESFVRDAILASGTKDFHLQEAIVKLVKKETKYA